MAETTRNKLRYPVEGDTPDVPRDIKQLAEDVDVKMVSWWEGTHAARPAAGQPNRFYKETDTGAIYHDTGATWEPILPGGVIRQTAASIAAVNGDLVQVTAAGLTITSPTTIVNNTFAVLSNGYGCTIKAATGKIFGDFVEPTTEVKLVGYQHLTLECDGVNWAITAGEPKREQAWTAQVERVVGTEYEPSATREVEVMVQVNGAVANFTTALINVGGVQIGSIRLASEANDARVATFVCPVGAKWKVSKGEGTGTMTLFSSYRVR